jgi:Ankyrin repeats (3 copies)
MRIILPLFPLFYHLTVLSTIRWDDGTARVFMTVLDHVLPEPLTNSNAHDRSMSPMAAAVAWHSAQYGGMTVAGWAIRLGSPTILQQLFKRGFDARWPVDVYGNTCLHVAAQYGSEAMVDAVMSCGGVRVEATNGRGYTPGMESSLSGNHKALRRLFKYGGSPRRSLDGKYWAWILALARRRERNEKNCQTGRIGDDDDTIFPSTDPEYLIWYSL